MPTSKTIHTKKQKVPAKVLPTDIDPPFNEFSESLSASDSASNSTRQQMIAEAAYYRAERRGFEPGHELEDWLAAEAEVTGSALQKTPVAGDIQEARTEIISMLM